jgi:peptidoglycan/LPS O-acetylase OafA/YrhL
MYYKQIDGIRAFAVAGPLFVHLWPNNVPNTPYTAALAHLGSLGVDLFFVISGFLITGILLRSKANLSQGLTTVRKSLTTFYIRRSIRIFPIYYLLLLILLVLGLPELRDNGGWYFAYLANFRIIEIGSWPIALSHVWSLSVEEQFYFVWPVLVLLVPYKALKPLFFALFCASPLIRVLMVQYGASSIAVSTLPFNCLEALAGGALLALFLNAGTDLEKSKWWMTVGLVGGIGSLISISYYVIYLKGGSMNGQLPLQRMFVSMLFIWVVGSVAMERTGRFKALLLARPIQFIGRISYGIYLYHLVIGWLLSRSFGLHIERSVFAFFILVSITLIVSTLSWYLIEQPVNRLKRFFPAVQETSTTMTRD